MCPYSDVFLDRCLIRIGKNMDQKNSKYEHFSHTETPYWVSYFFDVAHFWLMFRFYTPWKHQKNFGFLIF